MANDHIADDRKKVRLIDANAMHKFVEDKVAEGKDGWANGVPYEWAYALTAVDMQPTVDAVEVVRCGECRFVDTDACPMSGTPGRVSASDFCSYGERRESSG